MGYSALVLDQESFRAVTGILDGKFDRQPRPALVHSGIKKDSTPYARMAKHEEQKETIQDFDTQESVDHPLVDRIVGSGDP